MQVVGAVKLQVKKMRNQEERRAVFRKNEIRRVIFLSENRACPPCFVRGIRTFCRQKVFEMGSASFAFFPFWKREKVKKYAEIAIKYAVFVIDVGIFCGYNDNVLFYNEIISALGWTKRKAK